jgi:hypothetical protein
MVRRYPFAFPVGLRAEVLRRDGSCILSRIEPGHVCSDVWGNEHRADDLDRLTCEHVHTEGSMMGRKAPDDLAHLVAMCGFANVAVPSRVIRDQIRDYLRGVAA